MGWIFIARPVNISILIFIPFLLGRQLGVLLQELLQKPLRLLIFLACGLVFPILLFTLYKISTGSIWVYSYGKEGFDFLNPHVWDFLTSYDNGLVWYVPSLVVPFIVAYGSFKGEHKHVAWGAVATIAITIYIHASWWCWSYGSSFGPRTLLDFLSVFGILIALGLSIPLRKIVYVQYLLYVLCITLTMLLYDRKTHGRMSENPITSIEYWGSVGQALGVGSIQ